MLRKKGKLPGATIATYDLEYGTDTVEVQDAPSRQVNVVILDDLLATGGHARGRPLDRAGRRRGRGGACIIELSFLGGRDRVGVPLVPDQL